MIVYKDGLFYVVNENGTIIDSIGGFIDPITAEIIESYYKEALNEEED